MNGPHSDPSVPSFSEIPPCRGITLKLRLRNAVSAALQPGGRPLLPEKTDDGYILRVDRVDIHEIIEIPVEKEFIYEHFIDR
jgi:hypothetical protein